MAIQFIMELKTLSNTGLESIAPLFYDLHSMHVSMYPNIFKSIAIGDSISILNDLLQSTGSTIVTAHANSTLLGYVMFRVKQKIETPLLVARKILWVDQLYVKPLHRRAGVANYMIDYVEKKARELNCNDLELDYWHDNNHAGSFFCEKSFIITNCFLSKTV